MHVVGKMVALVFREFPQLEKHRLVLLLFERLVSKADAYCGLFYDKRADSR